MRGRLNISVIIPAFNAGDTIRETLDSVQKQSRQPFELIVIDDGSGDKTAEYAITHASRPRVIQTGNNGAAAAINLGIESSTGDFLAFVDADDIWTETKLEQQYNLLVSGNETDFVLSYMEAFVCPSTPAEFRERLVFKSGPQPGYLLGTLMARRAVFRRFGYFDAKLRTGYFIDWFSKLMLNKVKYRIHNEILLKRRIRYGTLSQRINGNDHLSSDFIEVARRAIARNRNNQSG